MVGSGASTSGTIILGGGTEIISSGGVGSGTTVLAGGVEVVLAGGTEAGATVSSGGGVTLDGTDEGATVVNGGVLTVYAGATASGTIIISGGVERVLSGGAEIGAIVSSGGVGAILSGGSASKTILAGGLTVSDGATAGGTTVLKGGTLTVSSGGIDSGATVSRGGIERVLPGGLAVGTTTLAGGTATISGAVASGAIVAFYRSGGVLALADPSAFAGQISGLTQSSQKIDLTGFAYGAGETVSWTEAAGNTSGTLTITDGAQVASLTLLGDYVTSNFTLASDAQSGTYVVDPPSLAGAHAFVQAMASLGVTGPSGSGGLNPISGGHGLFANAPILTVANREARRL
jgi:autotransporter passenger strand-loop-strand repeat protein